MAPLATTSQFLISLGVNVHVEYTDGKYANANNVVKDLSYLGISHVRDAVLNPSNQGQASYDVLASAGIKFDLFFQGDYLSPTLSLVDGFVQRHPGALSMIEGPNEVNNFPISYNGKSGDAAATAYQAALYAAVKSDPHVSDVPVADLTSYPTLSGPSDDANYHFYPLGGAQPGAFYVNNFANLTAQNPGSPIVMTEGGYTTLLAPNYFGGVDDLTQAKLLLNLFCDNAKEGVSETYVYQLLDAYADTSNSSPDDHFGLFNLDNTPKSSATAIHNLTTVLSTGVDASVSASPLSYVASALPSTASVLDLTKNGSTHDLLVWNEPTVWNSKTMQEVASSSVTSSFHFSDLSDVTVYDPLDSSQAIDTYTDVHDVTINVVDHPIILEVTKDPIPTAPSAGSEPQMPVASSAAPPPVVTASGSSVPTAAQTVAAVPDDGSASTPAAGIAVGGAGSSALANGLAPTAAPTSVLPTGAATPIGASVTLGDVAVAPAVSTPPQEPVSTSAVISTAVVEGVATVSLAGFAHDYATNVTNGDGEVSGGPEGLNETLVSVKNFQFKDGELTFDDGSVAAQIVRLYESFLGRAPDAAGLDAYLNFMAAGHTIQDAAANAAASPEFANATADLTNAQYIDYVYEQSLHRAPDGAGFAAYMAALGNGSMTRTSMMIQVSESPEHIALTSSIIAQGLWIPNEKVEGLELLYDAAVQRQPDSEGIAGYSAELAQGMSFKDIANQMALSPEFLDHHGAQSDAEFIDSLYVSELGRHADASGLAAYEAQLTQGYSRGDILYETAFSQEHQSHVLAYNDPLFG